MKQHGLLMNEFSVRAILDDRKTQTRRIVKPRNSYFDGGLVNKEVKEAWTYYNWKNALVNKRGPHLRVQSPDPWNVVHSIYPRVQVGDLIWGRETWRTLTDGRIIYRADYPNEYPGLVKWKSPIHLKKKDARIWLKVTDVRVERVQDITDDDAKAEGIRGLGGMVGENTVKLITGASSLEEAQLFILATKFIEVWDGIHGEGAWNRNDWVWIYEFERIETK